MTKINTTIAATPKKTTTAPVQEATVIQYFITSIDPKGVEYEEGEGKATELYTVWGRNRSGSTDAWGYFDLATEKNLEKKTADCKEQFKFVKHTENTIRTVGAAPVAPVTPPAAPKVEKIETVALANGQEAFINHTKKELVVSRAKAAPVAPPAAEVAPVVTQAKKGASLPIVALPAPIEDYEFGPEMHFHAGIDTGNFVFFACFSTQKLAENFIAQGMAMHGGKFSQVENKEIKKVDELATYEESMLAVYKIDGLSIKNGYAYIMVCNDETDTMHK